MAERSDSHAAEGGEKIVDTPFRGWSTDQICKIAILVLLGLNLNGELGAFPL